MHFDKGFSEFWRYSYTSFQWRVNLAEISFLKYVMTTGKFIAVKSATEIKPVPRELCERAYSCITSKTVLCHALKYILLYWIWAKSSGVQSYIVWWSPWTLQRHCGPSKFTTRVFLQGCKALGPRSWQNSSLIYLHLNNKGNFIPFGNSCCRRE